MVQTPAKPLTDKMLAIKDETLRSATRPTCAEYFAGIGLVRLGLEQAGWNVVFSNDWSHSKFEMYAAHFQDASAHYKVQDIFSRGVLVCEPLHLPCSFILQCVTSSDSTDSC
jgi:DNA (cytosine-5)-methyltransferase 1